MKTGLVKCLLCEQPIEFEVRNTAFKNIENLEEAIKLHGPAQLIPQLCYKVTIFSGRGNYGSTILDSMSDRDPVWELYFHDDCLIKKYSCIIKYMDKYEKIELIKN